MASVDRMAQFVLWYPRYHRKGSQLICEFDVSPLTDVLLDEGDRSIITHFADRLGVTEGRVFEWSVRPFNTPFYSYDIDAEDFGDWMSPAWRVRFVVDEWNGVVPVEPMGSVPAWGYDETWWSHRTPWDWNAHETVVIAVNGPSPDTDFLNSLGWSCENEVVVYRRPKFDVGHLRISLGRLTFPQEEAMVLETALACHRRAMAVHTEMAMSLMEQD
ncbi:hypothetical protein [Streptomyces sp. NPDC047974]|uniref:hypothetical protein n=1 Tax=Streptomyces sp. NPDC047974 TaxID=3154343 RepID=UPI0033DD015C